MATGDYINKIPVAVCQYPQALCLKGDTAMDIYDPIGEALGLPPIELESPEDFLQVSTPTGVNSFPIKVYGTQDRSFMQTLDYKAKQSAASKKSWLRSDSKRRDSARTRIKKYTCKAVIVEGILYNSLSECAAFYGISVELVRRRIKKYPGSWKLALLNDQKDCCP